jgi:hypothetical protein
MKEKVLYDEKSTILPGIWISDGEGVIEYMCHVEWSQLNELFDSMLE